MKKYFFAGSALLFFIFSSPVNAACGTDLLPSQIEQDKYLNFSIHVENVYKNSTNLYTHGAIDDSHENAKLKSFYLARDIWNSTYKQYNSALVEFKKQLDITLSAPITSFKSNCDLATSLSSSFSIATYSLLQQTPITDKAIFDLVQRTATTNDPYSGQQYYLKFSGIDAARQNGYIDQASPIIIAVIDDGIYINHDDLRDNIWINTKEQIGNGVDDDGNGYADDIYGYNFIDNSGEMTTTGSHGTHVGGIIGAVSNNTLGIQGIVTHVKLMPLIACDSHGSCLKAAVIRAIRYAVDNGAVIINLSLGSSGTTSFTTEYNDVVRYAFEHGVLIVAAAGNGDVEGGNGQNLDLIPQSPVCNDNNQNMVLGVSAIDTAANRTGWSNYGSECIDVYAPGVDILSTSVPAYDKGLQYSAEHGTSFSAPIVTGVAALIKQKYPLINPREITELIKKTSWMGILDAKSALNTRYDAYPIQISNPVIQAPAAQSSVSGISISDFVTKQIERQSAINSQLVNKLKGYILLQVQTLGAAWYLNPVTLKRYYLKDGPTAYEMLRTFGLGVSESDYSKIAAGNVSVRARLQGRIILRAQSHGEAYYISPKDLSVTYLKDGDAAYQAMRNLSLGISDIDIASVPIGIFVPRT